MSPLIVFKDLTLTYNRHPAVHHLSGRIEPGSLTAVIGPNGAGKSTLLKALAGLIRPAEGTLSFNGLTARDIAYLPQASAIDESFPILVSDVVMMGHWQKIGAFRPITRPLRDAAEAALTRVGLEGFGRRVFGTLSAGQRQRALFARLLLADCRMALLDEPFTAIDSRTTDDLLRLIKHWRDEGRAVVAVVHDFEQVRQHFPESLLMARRLIAWGPTPEVLTTANLVEARAMSEAWDEDAEICKGAA